MYTYIRQCSVGSRWNIKATSLDMEKKLIAGAFTTDHMLNYLHRLRQTYLGTSVFGLIHTFVNHEETQTGLEPLDDSLSLHVLEVAERMDTYLWILVDHGVRFGELRQSDAGWYEENNPALFLVAPLQFETAARLLTLWGNQHRLVSMYDLHKTLANLPHVLSCDALHRHQYTPHADVAFGVDLFETAVDEGRHCDVAGIPREFCPSAVEISLDHHQLVTHSPAILAALTQHIYSLMVQSKSSAAEFAAACEPIPPTAFAISSAKSRSGSQYSVVVRKVSDLSTGFFVDANLIQSEWTVRHATRMSAYEGEACHRTKQIPAELHPFCFCDST